MGNATINSTVQQFLTELASDLTPQSWRTNCIARLNSSTFDWYHGLVNETGWPVQTLTDAWGIDLPTCLEYCNANAIPYVSSKQRAEQVLGTLIPPLGP